MYVSFDNPETLPEKYTPGRIYFIGNEKAIYVAISETEVIKYSGYKELENKQDVIEDLEVIRTGASMAQNISAIDESEIDALFE